VLKAIFGCFLMMSAELLWRKTIAANAPDPVVADSPKENPLRALGIFCTAGFCGVAAGMVGIGGGVLLVPLLSLLFGFSQHKAQGTSLIALIPPTGLLAFLAYWNAGYADLHTGVLLIPGVFVGGLLGGMMARQLNARRMAEVFAGLMLLLGVWQVFSAWRG
jgi:uncharacterized membrane protein YfcA